MRRSEDKPHLKAIGRMDFGDVFVISKGGERIRGRLWDFFPENDWLSIQLHRGDRKDKARLSISGLRSGWKFYHDRDGKLHVSDLIEEAHISKQIANNPRLYDEVAQPKRKLKKKLKRKRCR